MRDRDTHVEQTELSELSLTGALAIHKQHRLNRRCLSGEKLHYVGSDHHSWPEGARRSMLLTHPILVVLAHAVPGDHLLQLGLAPAADAITRERATRKRCRSRVLG